MISMKTILVGTDFSDHSAVAVTYAAEIARAFDAEVVLCHVVASADFLSQLPPGGEGYFPPNLVEIQEERAQQDCQKVIAEAGIPRSRIRIDQGTPFVEIVRAAREENADLLIVGTHGRGAIVHALLGSVAERIVRKAPCPVLTVRKEEHDFVHP
jgi:nucleotide-binding universal stress UspA family protein